MGQRRVRRKRQVSHFPLRLFSRAGEGVSSERDWRKRRRRSPTSARTPALLPSRDRTAGGQRRNDRGRRESPASVRRAPGRPAAPSLPALRGSYRVRRAAAPPAAEVSRQETAFGPRPPGSPRKGSPVWEPRAKLPRAGLTPRPVALTGRAAAVGRVPLKPRLPSPSAVAPRSRRPLADSEVTPAGSVGDFLPGQTQSPVPVPLTVRRSHRGHLPRPAWLLQALTDCAKSGEAPPTALWSKFFFNDFWEIFSARFKRRATLGQVILQLRLD